MSRRASSSWAARASFMPLPPPPSTALTSSGKPMRRPSSTSLPVQRRLTQTQEVHMLSSGLGRRELERGGLRSHGPTDRASITDGALA